MKAVTFQGAKDIQVKNVKDPEIEKRDDIIVKITSTAICGSDLHIYKGAMPTTKGYVIGHEPMGIVEEVGPDVTKVKKGDRIVLPFNVSCGDCFYCTHDMESQCDNSNGNPHFDTGSYFGYTERYGNYMGGQAEYLRVPYGNFSPFIIPESSGLEDEQVLFLSDVLPTAYWSVENAGVKPGDTVVVLGCGPIGLMTMKYAWLAGAERVIAVDEIPYRMELAKKMNGVEIIDFSMHDDTGAFIHDLTQGGARVVIDCVGMDGKKSVAEAAQQKMFLQGGTLSAIKIAKDAVSKFGHIQLTGVYGMTYNMFPLGNLFERNVTLKMGQAPVHHLMPKLFKQVEDGLYDPRDIISHIMPMEKASEAYQIFNDHTDDCTKVILKP